MAFDYTKKQPIVVHRFAAFDLLEIGITQFGKNHPQITQIAQIDYQNLRNLRNLRTKKI